MTNPLTIELVYDRDCPHVERARGMIRAALDAVGLAPDWTEWARESAETPNELRRFGSPTVLVNGRDVACGNHELATADAKACRIYLGPNARAAGAPSSQLIVEAINVRLELKKREPTTV